MPRYESYDNFDPVWLVDITEYPQRKQTFYYSETTMKRYSDYHYNDTKGLISINPWDKDYLFIMNLIEKEGSIQCFYGKGLFGETIAQLNNVNSRTTMYDEEYERIKRIQSKWDF